MKKTSEVNLLGIKLFHKTQRDLAQSINKIIDKYWDDKIDQDEMIGAIQSLCEMNQEKLMKNGQFTTVIRQQCGKKRLEVVSFVIKMNQKSQEHFFLSNKLNPTK